MPARHACILRKASASRVYAGAHRPCRRGMRAFFGSIRVASVREGRSDHAGAARMHSSEACESRAYARVAAAPARIRVAKRERTRRAHRPCCIRVAKRERTRRAQRPCCIRVASVRFGSVRCRMGSARCDLGESAMLVRKRGDKKRPKRDPKAARNRKRGENAKTREFQTRK